MSSISVLLFYYEYLRNSNIVLIFAQNITTMDEKKLREVLSAYLSKEDIDKVIKDYNDPNWSNYIDSRF